MPKRRIDPATGEPGLTERELRFIDEYTNNGGNAAQAAAAAGYGAARAGQSAYQVLHRPEVDRRIRERIAQSRVCPDELIGTLASIMHGSLGQCYDESGKFSILVAKQNGVDHLIKSISETTRTIEATKTTPAQVVKTYSVQIHSPIQATTALARILGVNPKTLSRRPLPTDPRPLTPDPCQVITAEFNPLVWLDDLISKQMTESGLSRSEVIDNLIQTRPEIAKYVLDLEKARTPNPFDDLTMRQATKQLDLILDSLIALAQSTPTDPDTPGNPPPASGPETPDPPLTQDSRPTPDSPESMFSSDPPGAAGIPACFRSLNERAITRSRAASAWKRKREVSAFINVFARSGSDSRLTTHNSRLSGINVSLRSGSDSRLKTRGNQCFAPISFRGRPESRLATHDSRLLADSGLAANLQPATHRPVQ